MKVEVKGTQYLRTEAKDIHLVAIIGEVDLMELCLDGEETCSVTPIDSVYVDGELVWGKGINE